MASNDASAYGSRRQSAIAAWMLASSAQAARTIAVEMSMPYAAAPCAAAH
jgi:hypothetical protein